MHQQSPSSSRQASILIVEDIDSARESLLTLIRRNAPAYRTEATKSAEEAVKTFTTQPFDIVLLDINLEQGGGTMNGLDLLRSLHLLDHPFRAIAVSAYGEEYGLSAARLGVHRFLHKPFQREELFGAIRSELANLRAFAAKHPPRSVFCAMPFAAEFLDRYLFGIKSACETAGFLCTRVDEMLGITDILATAHRKILAADIIVADLTGANPNVYYEVGFARASQKRLILLAENEETLSFNLRNQRVLLYEGKIHLLRELLAKELDGLSQDIRD